MPDMDEILPIVKAATKSLFRYLDDHAAGFPKVDTDDRWGYAREIAIKLVEGKCKCGPRDEKKDQRQICVRPGQHDLAKWDSEKTLAAFIYKAAIGPTGLQAVSIRQGMLFPLLHDDLQLRLAKVGFKRCDMNPKHHYEGSGCPYDDSQFDPTATEVFAKDWLVKDGAYEAGPPQWACGRGRDAHYYVQRYCRQVTPEIPLRHGMQEDCCPLETCPRFGNQHGERGTVLWWRATFVGAPEVNFWDTEE